MEIIRGSELRHIIEHDLERRGLSGTYYPYSALLTYVRRHTRITTIGAQTYYARVGVQTTIDYWFKTHFKEGNVR